MIKYTKEQIEKAVSESYNYSDVFRKLNIAINGGSYYWIKKLIKRYDISTEHFSKKNINLINAGKVAVKDRAERLYLSKDLSRGHRMTSTQLRNFMIFHEVKERCSVCELKEWRGAPLRLDIDHIDNNPLNNKLENLQFICPNCHRAKTIKFDKSNNEFKVIRPVKEQKKFYCLDCSLEICCGSKRCIRCEMDFRKSNFQERFNKEQVISLLSTNSLLSVAKTLNISDNGLRKYCKRNQIDFKSLTKQRKTKNECVTQESNL